jgi:hypothetical protein
MLLLLLTQMNYHHHLHCRHVSVFAIHRVYCSYASLHARWLLGSLQNQNFLGGVSGRIIRLSWDGVIQGLASKREIG